MRQFNAVCLGGVAWDELLVLPGTPDPGELVRVLARASAVGGAGRCALALAALDFRVQLSSRQGAGLYGVLAREELEAAGIVCDLAPTPDAHVSTVLLVDGERTILASPVTDHAGRRPDLPADLDLIVCATSDAEAFIEAAARAPDGTVTSYDGGDRPDALRLRAAMAADVVTGRPRFFAQGTSSTEEGVAKLLDQGTSVVAVTDGGRPVHVWTQDSDFLVDVPPGEAVDTTGCGDVFHAVLAGRVAAGWSVGDAANDAVAAASAHAGVLGNGELHRRLRAQRVSRQERPAQSGVTCSEAKEATGGL